MAPNAQPIDAELLVALFNYGSMHRREILADMEDYSEHIELSHMDGTFVVCRDADGRYNEFTGV